MTLDFPSSVPPFPFAENGGSEVLFFPAGHFLLPRPPPPPPFPGDSMGRNFPSKMRRKVLARRPPFCQAGRLEWFLTSGDTAPLLCKDNHKVGKINNVGIIKLLRPFPSEIVAMLVHQKEPCCLTLHHVLPPYFSRDPRRLPHRRLLRRLLLRGHQQLLLRARHQHLPVPPVAPHRHRGGHLRARSGGGKNEEITSVLLGLFRHLVLWYKEKPIPSCEKKAKALRYPFPYFFPPFWAFFTMQTKLGDLAVEEGRK